MSVEQKNWLQNAKIPNNFCGFGVRQVNFWINLGLSKVVLGWFWNKFDKNL